MKTKKIMGACAVLSLSLSFASVSQANDHQYLNSDPIDINGYVHAEVEPTDQELENVKGQLNFAKKQSTLNKAKAKKYQKLANETEKLSETSEELIRERAQAQKDIQVYQKKIDCLMGRETGPECDRYQKNRRDEVRTGYAAPSQNVVTENVAPRRRGGDNFGETIKVVPYTGYTSFETTNESLEAGINIGLQLESNISSRFAVGMGVQYTTFSTDDFGTNNYRDQQFGYGYQSSFGSREIEYSNINFDLYSKFYLIKNSRFRPYVGAGIGYNRTSMEYGDEISNQGYMYGYQYANGSEELTASSMSAEMMAGSEVVFTDTIGMILEMNYTRGFGGKISQEGQSYNGYYAPDQERLEDLAAELQEANILSLYAGMLIQF